MKKLKIALLIHKGLLPPDSLKGCSKEEIEKWQVEYDVIHTLKENGHDVFPVEMYGELEPFRELIDEVKPDIAFNLLEEFNKYPLFDQQVVSYLELKKIPYTGCNPRGLMLAKDKALTKKILSFHKINVPEFEVYPLRKRIRRKIDINYPLFVKSLSDEGSNGISEDSIVNSDEKLKKRIEYLHKNFSTDVIAEELIEGREIYVGVMGSSALTVLPPWELILKNSKSKNPIATSRLKWDEGYQKKVGLVTKPASLSDKINKKFRKISREIYKYLHLNGYARLDFKLTEKDEIFLIEANPNPFLAKKEDFAESAKYAGISYDKLLNKIISYGLTYKPF